MSYEILTPIGTLTAPTQRLAERRLPLAAARVGLLSNQKPNADEVLVETVRALEQRLGQPLRVQWFKKRIQSQPMPEDMRAAIAAQCDAVIHGVGD